MQLGRALESVSESSWKPDSRLRQTYCKPRLNQKIYTIITVIYHGFILFVCGYSTNMETQISFYFWCIAKAYFWQTFYILFDLSTLYTGISNFNSGVSLFFTDSNADYTQNRPTPSTPDFRALYARKPPDYIYSRNLDLRNRNFGRYCSCIFVHMQERYNSLNLASLLRLSHVLVLHFSWMQMSLVV